ncbi:hypothetical protein FHW16_005206 [Phyllobacterium myrsinacearum]|uniref:Uncharacterized protein n=1 Tax=Phyllobacterium myrsinacearum TaxID=28101 RepID=A0A839ETM9_9HYPH|nr:hypothetical protein [Phyllobacterium myrsinacearum]
MDAMASFRMRIQRQHMISKVYKDNNKHAVKQNFELSAFIE